MTITRKYARHRALKKAIYSLHAEGDCLEIVPSVSARFALAWDHLAAEDAIRSAWLAENSRTPDPDERDTGPTCMRCEGPVKANPSNGRFPKLCQACSEAGWRPQRCDCGAVLHKRDWAAYGFLVKRCGKCREEMRRNLKGRVEAA